MPVTSKFEQFNIEVSLEYARERKLAGDYPFTKLSKWMQVGAIFKPKSSKRNGMNDLIYKIQGFTKAGQVTCLCLAGCHEGQVQNIWLWDMPKYTPAKTFENVAISQRCKNCVYFVSYHNACNAFHNIALLGDKLVEDTEVVCNDREEIA